MRKIKRTGIFVLILCLCVIGNVVTFRYYLAKTINLKTTYIAKHNIKRTLLVNIHRFRE